MITELFSMLSSLDVSRTKGTGNKFTVNLNRNRIRSISAYSSNAIFYFQTVTSDQVTPEEMAMISRVLEKSYASFVVTCISLMPFHRIKSDDQASIEEYLSQFHQNLGITPGANAAMGKMLGLVSTLEEAVEPTSEDLAATQTFLMECWEKSRKNCTDFIQVVSETVSLNDMYKADPIDPVTRLMQEQYLAVSRELETWGFIGEATADMFDAEADDLEDLSDEEIIQSVMGSGQYESDDDEPDEEDEYPELDGYLDESNTRRYRNDTSLNEGNVRSAIDSIMFALESVSENKILSCSNLTKLNSLEAKLNKLKNKYAKYLSRYKKKYKENEENGTHGKLTIRFNGATISNPKAFMKQYGAYIKIINKRLKLIEKRRAELRKRKGLPDGSEDKKLQENGIAVLGDADLNSVDFCIRTIDESLEAPDVEIFALTEASKAQMRQQLLDLEDKINDYEAELADTSTRVSNLARANVQKQSMLDREMRAAKHSHEEARKQKLGRQQAERRLHALQMSDKELQTKLKEAQRRENQLKKEVDRLNAAQKKGPVDSRQSAPDAGDGLVFDKQRPRSALNVTRAAIANGYEGHHTFDRSIFTDMDMRKSNEAIPTYAKATIGFIVDETEQVVTRDVLVGIKVYLHRIAAMDLISDIYNCLINKRKFLRFVKFITGEEKSLADLLFGFKELKVDALNSRPGSKQWAAAFRRRKRWSKMTVPYLMKEYTPNGTVVLTMNEVQYIKDEYGIDIMLPDHVNMIMDASFLLGFVVLDQANEMAYITYDGHGGNFQQYSYGMLERESNTSDRMIRELYRSMSR